MECSIWMPRMLCQAGAWQRQGLNIAKAFQSTAEDQALQAPAGAEAHTGEPTSAQPGAVDVHSGPSVTCLGGDEGLGGLAGAILAQLGAVVAPLVTSGLSALTQTSAVADPIGISAIQS